MLNCMTMHTFTYGSTVFQQDEICNCAYLIIEGECKLSFHNKSAFIIKKLNNSKYFYDDLKSRRGLSSGVLSNLQLGIAVSGEWIGDSFLSNDSEKYLYSAITNSMSLSCLKLSLSEYKNMPTDLLRILKAQATKKIIWLNERIATLSNSITKIINLQKNDTSTVNYNENYFDTKAQYPRANEDALLSFRKKEIVKYYDTTPPSPMALPTVIRNTPIKIPNTDSKIRPINFMQSVFQTPQVSRFYKSAIVENNYSNNKTLTTFKSRNRSPMKQASSYARKTVQLIPTQSVYNKKHATRNCFITAENEEDTLPRNDKIDVETRNFVVRGMNTFHIGKKSITVLDFKKLNKKPTTPNPFYVLKNRDCVTSANSPKNKN